MNRWLMRRVNKNGFSRFIFAFPLYFSLCLNPIPTSQLTSISYYLDAGHSTLLTVFYGTYIFLPCSMVVCAPALFLLLDYQPSQNRFCKCFIFCSFFLSCGYGIWPKIWWINGRKQLSEVVSCIVWPSIALRIENGTFSFSHFSPTSLVEGMKGCHCNPIFCQCC